jgi:hypothetical protein
LRSWQAIRCEDGVECPELALRGFSNLPRDLPSAKSPEPDVQKNGQ